jgi:hypothetical protein
MYAFFADEFGDLVAHFPFALVEKLEEPRLGARKTLLQRREDSPQLVFYLHRSP